MKNSDLKDCLIFILMRIANWTNFFSKLIKTQFFKSWDFTFKSFEFYNLDKILLNKTKSEFNLYLNFASGKIF